jgi:cytochrome c553
VPADTVLTVPDSTVHYKPEQVHDSFFAPDWHPDEHPAMPPVVARGRKPDVWACGYCHRADGPGGPESASLYGLPFDYIVQQLADYKSGKRSTALPERLPQQLMIRIAKALTPEEVSEAARYFSSVKPRANIKVVETNRIPKVYVATWLWAFEPSAPPTEPLGERIIDTPESLERHERRDSHTQFVAYVPVGSVRRGAAIVNGKMPDIAPACAACHGKGLTGEAAVPGIAGRYPSYVVRQLYEFKSGIRAGDVAPMMKAVTEHLSTNDMIAIAAYLASLKP